MGEAQIFHVPGGYLIPHPFAESWNGSKWSVVATPALTNSGASLNGVSCTGASSCMAVGDFTGTGNEMTLAEAWNGTAWSVVKTPRP